MQRFSVLTANRPLAFTRLFALAVLLGSVGARPAVAFMSGVDVSSLPVFEDAGAIYTDQGQPGDAIEILRDHGTNWFRIRLFVDPMFQNNYNGGYDPFVAQDLGFAIDLAKRVRRAGGNVLLDLHYSDTWADPGHQTKPAAWEGLPFNQLVTQVYDYTRDVITSFKNEGVTPGVVQIGNEIPSGMLWDENNPLNGGNPYAGGSQEAGFDRLAQLLSAGIQGVRDAAASGANPAPAPLTMIHHDRADRLGDTNFFLNELLTERGLDFDLLGFSYYPLFHSGDLADVQATLNATAATYNKPVVIAETGFTYSTAFEDDDYEFPSSVQGQSEFLQALVDIVKAVPSGLGGGVFWWHGDATPTPGLPVWRNGRYGLFDQSGELLPTIAAFEEFYQLPGDFNADGSVDSADYTVWRDGLGTVYNQAHYELWVENYGSELPLSPPAVAAPEPATVLLLAASAVAVRRRR